MWTPDAGATMFCAFWLSIVRIPSVKGPVALMTPCESAHRNARQDALDTGGRRQTQRAAHLGLGLPLAAREHVAHLCAADLALAVLDERRHLAVVGRDGAVLDGRQEERDVHARVVVLACGLEDKWGGESSATCSRPQPTTSKRGKSFAREPGSKRKWTSAHAPS